MGERFQNIENAKLLLLKKGCLIIEVSSFYETAAWGMKNQPNFINQVIKIQTQLGPHELMGMLVTIEKDLGRIRQNKWGPRIIDLDILFFNDAIVEEDHLTIPHPHLHERNFVLSPLKEIAANHFHPILKMTIDDLISQTKDESAVVKLVNNGGI